MHDDILGDLERLETDGDVTWRAMHKLPYLAQFGIIYSPDEADEGPSPEDEAELKADLEQAMADIQERISGLVGEETAKQLVDDMRALEESGQGTDAEFEEELESDEEYAARVKLEDERFLQGIFPVEIEDADGISEPQRESIKLFFENDKQFLGDIFRDILADYREGQRSQPEWFTGLPKVKRVEDLKPMVRCHGLVVSRYHIDGFAYIGLSFRCEWDQEHGLGVLWHPTRGIVVGPAETAFDIEEADNFEEEAPETPARELIRAFFDGDDERVQELKAEGADVNGFDPKQDDAPLCVAIENLEVEQVKALLALGADPNKAGAERTSPIKKAREVFQSLDFDTARGMAKTMIAVAMKANPEEHAVMHASAAEIVRLLEEAGAK